MGTMSVTKDSARIAKTLLFSKKQPGFRMEVVGSKHYTALRVVLSDDRADSKKLGQSGVTASSARMAPLSFPKRVPTYAGVPAGDAIACSPRMDRYSRVFNLGRLRSDLSSFPRLKCAPPVHRKRSSTLSTYSIRLQR